MDVPRPRKWPLVKVFQVVSPSARDGSNPIRYFPSWGQFSSISVSHIPNSFLKYQISSTELSCLNISVITSSEILLILGQSNDRRFPIFLQQVRCSIIISSFWTGLNPSIRALHTFTSTGMTASAPYVRENGVSLVDLRGVVRYAHKTLGSFSAQLPLAPSNLLFNPFRIALLTALACPLL